MRSWAHAIEQAASWCTENDALQMTPEYVEAAAAAEGVIVGTYIKNAFGSMHRSGAISAVAQCCPQLAGLLASSWCRGTRLWARSSDKEWVCTTSYRGGAQGRLSTQVAFCDHLHEVLANVEGLQLPEVVRVGIVDDQYTV